MKIGRSACTYYIANGVSRDGCFESIQGRRKTIRDRSDVNFIDNNNICSPRIPNIQRGIGRIVSYIYDLTVLGSSKR